MVNDGFTKPDLAIVKNFSWSSTSLKLFPFWIPDRGRFAPLSGMTRFKGYAKKKYSCWGERYFIISPAEPLGPQRENPLMSLSSASRRLCAK